MKENSDLYYRLFASGGQNRIVAEYIANLERLLIGCSSYIPSDSICGQQMRHLLPWANWWQPTLKQVLPSEEPES